MSVRIPDFYLFPAFGGPTLAAQYPNLRNSFGWLNAVMRNSFIDESSNITTHVLNALAYGELLQRFKFRWRYDATNDEFQLQQNTTDNEASPTWTTIIKIRESDGRVTITGSGGLLVTGGFYNFGPLDVAVTAAGGAAFGDVGTLLFDSSSGFYLMPDSSGRPIVSINVAAASGTVTDGANVGSGANVFKQKVASTLQFRTILAGSNVTVTENTNDVTIAASSAGETNTASNLGSGLGVWFDKQGVDLRFKSLVGGPGVNLSATDSEITIAAPEFYTEFKESEAGGYRKRSHRLTFDSEDFYLSSGGDKQPLVSLAAPGVTFTESRVNGRSRRSKQLYVDSAAFYIQELGNTGVPLLGLQPRLELNQLDMNGFISLLEIIDPTTPDTDHAVLWASDDHGHTVVNIKDDDGQNIQISRDNVLVARNTTGSTLAAGTAVYISGTTGDAPQVTLARADSASTMPAIGILPNSISNNTFGLVFTQGVITGIDLSAYSAGDNVWVSPTSAGALTSTEPSHPNFHQQVGVVIRATSSGILLVNMDHADGDDTGTNTSTFTFGTSSAASVVLANTSTAQRTATFPNKTGTVAFLDDITGGGGGGGFYGVVFKESKAGGRVERDDTLVFDSAFFYLTQAGDDGKPLVSLSTCPGVRFEESSGSPSFFDDRLVFNSQHFYLTQAGNDAEPMVNLRVAPPRAVTVTTLTSGSGTYTPPSGANYIWVRLIGAGGGGAGTATDGTGGNGGTGGNTTFGTLTGGGGVGGTGTGAAVGGAGGTGTGGDLNLRGGTGAGQNGVGPGIHQATGTGGCGVFGGFGNVPAATGVDGQAAQANTGGGGSGGSTSTTTGGGPGGGAGGYVEKLFSPLSASYSYSIGSGGSGGTAGTGGNAGGAGGSGVIIIHEHY